MEQERFQFFAEWKAEVMPENKEQRADYGADYGAVGFAGFERNKLFSHD